MNTSANKTPIWKKVAIIATMMTFIGWGNDLHEYWLER